MKRNTAILLHRAISVALAHVALPAAALYAQDAAVSTAEVETENGKVSALRAAAEAIDPLGRAAQAEALSDALQGAACGRQDVIG